MLEPANDVDVGRRVVAASHGLRHTFEAPAHEREMVLELMRGYTLEERLQLYARFAAGTDRFSGLMRRMTLAASARACGPGLQVDVNVSVRHMETVQLGSDVFIGTQACIQGRFDGICSIGSNTWIGPQVFLDARHLDIGEHVGLGPGCRILGSAHTGQPADLPIIATDLAIAPVRIEDGADIGINAVIMPGVVIGAGAIVGAGAVVTEDVKPYSIVAGVPARFLRWRAELATRDNTNGGDKDAR